MAQGFFHPRRKWARWVLAWGVLTALGSWLHIAFWMGEPAGAGAMGSTMVRAAANLLYLPSAPFSLFALIGLDFWGARGAWQAIVLDAVTWAFWLTMLWVAMALRRRLRGPRPAGVARTAEVGGISRRRLLLDVVGGAATLGVATPVATATLANPWNLRVERYTVKIRDLPDGLEGLRIVQISDTHLGPRIPAEFVRRAVGLAIDLGADVYALTGDYVHNGASQVQLAAELFVPLVATGKPVVGTLGNHDHYADPPTGGVMSRALGAIGVRMIDNDRVFLDAATRGLHESAPSQGLCLAGLADYGQALIDPGRALGGVPPSMPRVVLSHNPDSVEDPRVTGGPRLDLMLSGHLHGGQIKLPFVGNLGINSRFRNKYIEGLVQAPTCQIVISRGVGMSVLPVRFGVPPELVEITLTRG
ncbi:MAG: metallophosphoesterase [Planctomycetota bacterium]